MAVAEYSDEASEGEYNDQDAESDTDDSLRRITECHGKLLKDSAKRTKASPPLGRISPDITAKGEEGKTVLHLIATPPRQYLKLLPLVPWLLESAENQELLSVADDDGWTALDRAISRKIWDMVECLLQFDGFVKAASSIGRSPENTCLHDMINNLMKPARAGSSKRKDSAKVLDPFWNCIEKLISKPMRDVMMVKGNKGNTPLHLAVVWCETITLETQQKLIFKLISACPESMKICNTSSQSPYQYRVQSLSTREIDPNKLKLELKQDRILFYLKDHYMHYASRDEAAKYLYGNGRELEMEFDLSEHHQTGYSLSEESRNNLSHLKFENILRYVDFPKAVVRQASDQPTNPKPKSQGKMKPPPPDGIGRKDLKGVFEWLAKSGVEKIIRVRVQDTQEPPHSEESIEAALKDFQVEVWDWVRIDICSDTIFKAAPDVTKIYLYSNGNNAVLKSWSGIDGLKKLKKLTSVDLLVYQTLESYKTTHARMKDFETRLSDQIPGITITGMVERWTGKGLNISDSHEERSPEQTHMWLERMKYFVGFIETLSTEDEQPNGPDETSTSSVELSTGAGEISTRQVKTSTGPAKSIAKISNGPVKTSTRSVKVALIDDGVDGTHRVLGSNIRAGKSFCVGTGPHNPVYSYFMPSGCHGTQMASLIRDVCPRVELYVARLQEMGGGGTRTLTAESAIKAIYWAIDREVDIISMSWTFEKTEDNQHILEGALKDAVALASSKNILMFCSTGDQGKCANDDNIYPACLPSVFKIGAAKPSGNDRDWTEASHFTFPGEDLKVEIPSYIGSGEDSRASGSSLATALASGLAALILYCIDATNNDQLRERARSYISMKKAFKKMTKTDQPKYIRAWEWLKPELADLDKTEGRKQLKEVMESLFAF